MMAALLGGVNVVTSTGRGFTPDELADQAIDKIMYVGEQSHPAIRDQAQAFKTHIRAVLVQYMKRAIQSDRTTIANRLREAGHPELIDLLKD
jgi:hypothetical protein